MSDIKKAIKALAGDKGLSSTLDRFIVLDVDKNELTCSVQLVTDDSCVIEDVKLKSVTNDGDLTKLGIVIFPVKGSFVTIGQVDNDNTDLVVLQVTEIESITLDTATALKLLVGYDGKVDLNAVLMTFNQGKNGGLVLIKPLTDAINKLQKQVNDLVDAFTNHKHIGVTTGGGVSGITTQAAPAKTNPLIKVDDIENKAIIQ